MNSIIIDLEMNEVIGNEEIKPHKALKFEIMEIGAVKLNEDLVQIDEYKAYIKPARNPIGERYTKLTGISDETVKDADSFETGIMKFVEWCGTDYRIYSWSDADRAQIKKESIHKHVEDEGINYMLSHWTDFQAQFSRILGIHKSVGLKDAVTYAGIDFEGREHDALFDAKNTASLYVIAKDENRLKKIMRPFVESMRKRKTMTFSLGELMSGIVVDGKVEINEEK